MSGPARCESWVFAGSEYALRQRQIGHPVLNRLVGLFGRAVQLTNTDHTRFVTFCFSRS
jgi:hypothetical protein